MTDRALSALTIYPFRCQLCAHRFRAFLGRRTKNPRRSFDRVEVSFPVWFKSRRSAFSNNDMGMEGTIDNLSLRGCRIRCVKPLQPGSRLELEFQHYNNSFPIAIDEAVVRSCGNQTIGLRFTQLRRNDERRIRHIVDL